GGARLLEEPLGDVDPDDVVALVGQAPAHPAGAAGNVEDAAPRLQPPGALDQVDLLLGVLERLPAELDALPRREVEHLLPPGHGQPLATRPRTRAVARPSSPSLSITVAAFRPGTPITPPPGCVPAPQRYRPFTGVR